MDSPLRVLVVGAGAVGQVYAYHLQRGGAAVTFFVRAKYQAEVAAGFDLYALNRGKRQRGEPLRFDGYDVVTEPAEVAARTFDQVWLTVSSPALDGPWLAALMATTKDATIVALQPGADARDTILAAGVPAERLVSGLISLISYHAPLPGETRFPKPGMAFWFPPGGPSPFSGPDARVAAVVDALKRGKMPAKRHKDVPGAAAFPNAVMMPYLVALENAGWSFDALMRGPLLAAGARAAREALAIAGGDRKPPFGVRTLARPRILRMGLWFGKKIIPLPLETYLRVHFTKVGDQTRMFMTRYIEAGRVASRNVDALSALMTALPPSR